MADRTNITDTLPDGRTVTSLVETHDHGGHDASTRFGQTHDTWHRTSSSTPPSSGAAPTLRSLNPDTVASGVVAPVRVMGTGFTPTSVIQYDGVPIYRTDYVSDVWLWSISDPNTNTDPGVYSITVVNDGEESNALTFTVT